MDSDEKKPDLITFSSELVPKAIWTRVSGKNEAQARREALQELTRLSEELGLPD